MDRPTASPMAEAWLRPPPRPGVADVGAGAGAALEVVGRWSPALDVDVDVDSDVDFAVAVAVDLPIDVDVRVGATVTVLGEVTVTHVVEEDIDLEARMLGDGEIAGVLLVARDTVEVVCRLACMARASIL